MKKNNWLLTKLLINYIIFFTLLITSDLYSISASSFLAPPSIIPTIQYQKIEKLKDDNKDIFKRFGIIPSFTITFKDIKTSDPSLILRGISEFLNYFGLEASLEVREMIPTILTEEILKNPVLFPKGRKVTFHLQKMDLKKVIFNIADKASQDNINDDNHYFYTLLRKLHPQNISVHMPLSARNLTVNIREPGHSVLPLNPSDQLSKNESIDNAIETIELLQSKLSSFGYKKEDVLVENLDYHRGGAYEASCDPESLTKVINETGCGLLIDTGHVIVSAQNLGEDPLEYFKELIDPHIEKLRELHVCTPEWAESEKGSMIVDVSNSFHGNNLTHKKDKESNQYVRKMLEHVFHKRGMKGITTPLIINFETIRDAGPMFRTTPFYVELEINALRDSLIGKDFETIVKLCGNSRAKAFDKLFEWQRKYRELLNKDITIYNLSTFKNDENPQGVEYFYVVDKHGNYTGKIKPRDLVHREGDWHLSIYVLIFDSEGNLILQRRSADRQTDPNKLEGSVSGHVGLEKDLRVAACRETREELGLNINPEDLMLIGTLQKDVFNRLDINRNEFHNRGLNQLFIYILPEGISGKTLHYDPVEVSELIIMPYEQVLEHMSKNPYKYGSVKIFLQKGSDIVQTIKKKLNSRILNATHVKKRSGIFGEQSVQICQ